MASTISASVGPRQRDKNRPADVKVIRELLNAIPAASGGPASPIAAGDMDELFAAIRKFQLKHKLVRKPGVPWGFIGPKGKTLPKLRQLTGQAPGGTRSGTTIPFPIPNDKRFHQNSSKWNKIKLNRSRSATIGVKGCALTSVATGFAAKGLKIADTDGMEEVLRSKLGAKFSTVGDMKEITPLTFEAWMTAGGGQGYDKTKNLNISWKNVANISPSVKFKNVYYPYKSRYHRLSQIRRYLDAKKIVIGHISTYGGAGTHYVVLTGHNGGTTIYFWDVGYGYHTGSSDPFEANAGRRGAGFDKAKSYPSADYEVFDQFIVYE